jgi:nucleotide-binding universal stress UspA family protein
MTALSIEHILVAHDFGDHAQNALEYALSLAEKVGARVTVVHAYELPIYGFPDGLALTVDVTLRIQTASTEALDAILAKSQRPGVPVSGMVRQGPAWSEIAAAAGETKADLVVVGTHGRRGLAHALLGSVAEKVTRSAPCPVLVVRGSSV